MKYAKLKDGLFILILATMLLPLLNQQYNFFKSKPLYKVIPASNVKFSWATWWNDSFQVKKETYINDSIGFRTDLVRITNQLDYWLLAKAHPSYVVIGKQNYLYQVDYINAYCGINYNDSEQNIVRHEIKKLKFLQDTLSKLGKQIILVYAPSKAWYYPEYFPFYLRNIHKQHSIYHDYKRIGDSAGIKTIDFNKWFAGMKDTTRHLLFTIEGIHWTKYGAYLAADSIIKYISRVRNINMPSLVLDKITETDTVQSSETDLAKLLNLYYPVAHERFSYPVYHYNDDTTKTKPEVIYIGDSFFWTLNELELPQRTSKYWEFWYYFKDVWNQKVITQIWNGVKNPSTENIAHYNWQEKVNEADCILVINTEVNLLTPGNGFIDSVYNYYCPDCRP